jgi:hypothetical protein
MTSTTSPFAKFPVGDSFEGLPDEAAALLPREGAHDIGEVLHLARSDRPVPPRVTTGEG